ncbi:hypothetical protein [Pedobacter sp. ASV28]|uniref:hypothetical protein n=1 Tax=Pedobacter sp. ASV28 TaxID=2795123 RepID=UPI0018ECB799|nr:hypothetical protein [Pedobacter sp. ASV28]
MKPVFSRNEDIDKMSFLNWRISKDDDIQNLINIANGYLEASIRLAKLCLITNHNKIADILIFPVLNNANHGIEIYLKAIIWTLNKILNSGERTQRGHNLKQLYRTVVSKIKSYGGGITLHEFNVSTIGLKSYIDELFETIKGGDKKDNMDFSRYPFNTNYESHFYVEKLGNVEVDLENFVERFEEIKTALDNIASYLYYDEMTD